MDNALHVCDQCKLPEDRTGGDACRGMVGGSRSVRILRR